MYTLTGNVQYYQRFCLDSMGRPLVNGNPQVTEGWDIPVYPNQIRSNQQPPKQKYKQIRATAFKQEIQIIF